MAYVIFDDDKFLHHEPVKDKDEAVDRIIKEYFKYDVSMYDMLAAIKLEGFSIEDNVYIYATCMNMSDEDTIIHFRDEGWSITSDDYERLGKQ